MILTFFKFITSLKLKTILITLGVIALVATCGYMYHLGVKNTKAEQKIEKLEKDNKGYKQNEKAKRTVKKFANDKLDDVLRNWLQLS